MKKINIIALAISSLIFMHYAVYCIRVEQPEASIEHFDQKNRTWRKFISKICSITHPAFNFNPIVDAPRLEDVYINGVCIERRADGQITRITDGKSPIVLGSVPSTQEDIERLRKEFKLKPNDVIHIHSLLDHHENRSFGVDELRKKNPETLKVSYYPTVDYGPPSLAALASFVDSLEHRPDNDKLTYVHCKAGKGRSAVSLASYLAHLCIKSGEPTPQENVYSFLKGKRNRINFKEHHWNAFNQFCYERNKVSSSKDLCDKYPYTKK